MLRRSRQTISGVRRSTFYALLLLIGLGCPLRAMGQEGTAPVLFPVYLEKKGGYIDRSGKIILPPKFDSVAGFSEGLAAVMLGDKWGYVNQSGALVVPLRFDAAQKFSGGLAAVLVRGKYGYIDRSGQLVIPPRFEKADDFSEGLALTKIKDRFSFIDTSGAVVIRAEYDYADSFHHGAAVVARKNGDGTYRVGYINKLGELMFGEWFVSAGRFSDRVAIVSHDGTGFSTLSRGELLFDNYDLDTGFQHLTHFEVINLQGAKIAEGDFQELDDFSEGLAAVRLNGKYGFINKQGQVVIEPKFETVNRFSEGLALVHRDGKTAYIDREGKIIFNTSYGDSFLFASGLLHIRDCSDHRTPCKTGYVNREGATVWKPTR